MDLTLPLVALFALALIGIFVRMVIRNTRRKKADADKDRARQGFQEDVWQATELVHCLIPQIFTLVGWGKIPEALEKLEEAEKAVFQACAIQQYAHHATSTGRTLRAMHDCAAAKTAILRAMQAAMETKAQAAAAPAEQPPPAGLLATP
jgi:hypothetical protein